MGRAFEYRREAKQKRWNKMSKVFPKLAKAITVAAKEGGNPELNFKLRTAIQNAKAENMPKSNIEAAIKRAYGKNIQTLVEATYEGKGPYGVLVFVECATDNITRTVSHIKSYFNKAGGMFVPSGSLEYMFSRKAVFEFEELPEGINYENLELALIDAGLEKIEEVDGKHYAYGDFVSFGALNKVLEDLKIHIKKASLKRIANSHIEFSDEQLEEIEKMLDKIEYDDDVQSVFTNIL